MKAWELLSDESKWTQRAAARNKDGRHVDPRSPRAVCWCALGAIQHCYRTSANTVSAGAAILCLEKFDCSLSALNDLHADAYATVLSFLKELDI